jgi:hypothetical protein
MSLVAPGPTTIPFRGHVIPRDKGFVDMRDITCPDGHRVRLAGALVRDEVGLTCHHAIGSSSGECGALLWLLYVPTAGHRKRFYVADITIAEHDLWEREHYSVEDVLRYLGAWFTRGDAGALRRRSQ